MATLSFSFPVTLTKYPKENGEARQKLYSHPLLAFFLYFCATPAQGAGQNGPQPPERGVGEDQAREPRAAGAAPGQPGSTPDRAGLPHPGSRRAHQGPPTQRAGETTREADQPSTNARRDCPSWRPAPAARRKQRPAQPTEITKEKRETPRKLYSHSLMVLWG